MATYTSTVFINNPAKAVHAGVNSVSGQFNLGTQSVSASDILFLAKLPHGATVVDVIEDHTNPAGALVVSTGLATGGPGGSAIPACFILNGAANAVNRRSVTGVPITVSVSDNDPNRYGILAARVEAGSVAGANQVYNFTILYRLD